MKRLKQWTLAAVLLLTLCGCSWREAARNLDNARQLRVGMTKQQVLDLMGEPVKDELFVKPDVWYYFIQPNWVDGLTTEDECMPLVFRDGRLAGWGNEYYARHKLMPKKPGTNEQNVRELKLQ